MKVVISTCGDSNKNRSRGKRTLLLTTKPHPAAKTKAANAGLRRHLVDESEAANSE